MSLTDPTADPAPPQADPPAPPRRGHRLPAQGIAVLSRGYLVLMLAAWAVLRFAGEAWWPATFLALGPRWVLATPLAALVPIALLVRRRSLVTLAVSAVVVVGPVMDLCLPWRRLLPATASRGQLRILTCNVHTRLVNTGAMAELMSATQPDVATFEEWNGWPGDPTPDRNTSTALPGWHGLTDFEVHVESRYPIRKVADVIWGKPWASGAATRYEVLTPTGPVPLLVAHLVSPHDVIRSALTHAGKPRSAEATDAVEDNAAERHEQATTLGNAARAAGPTVICAGDLNLPCDAAAFRHAFTGLTDAFTTGGFGFGWSYRVRWTAVRIDHVLTGPAWRCRHCWVGPDVGSPHRPVIADLERVPAT